jgi:hypothetical protein
VRTASFIGVMDNAGESFSGWFAIQQTFRERLIALMMETIRTSETSVYSKNTTEGCHLQDKN